jgi:hypothetical protein
MLPISKMTNDTTYPRITLFTKSMKDSNKVEVGKGKMYRRLGKRGLKSGSLVPIVRRLARSVVVLGKSQPACGSSE